MNDKLKNLSQHQIEALALKGLEAEADAKRYSLWHITRDLISDLENNKEEILEDEHPQDLISVYVDCSISVYTYDQIMIFANNNDLWHRIDEFGADDINQQIVGAIYSYLAEEADAWLFNQEQATEEV